MQSDAFCSLEQGNMTRIERIIHKAHTCFNFFFIFVSFMTYSWARCRFPEFVIHNDLKATLWTRCGLVPVSIPDSTACSTRSGQQNEHALASPPFLLERDFWQKYLRTSVTSQLLYMFVHMAFKFTFWKHLRQWELIIVRSQKVRTKAMRTNVKKWINKYRKMFAFLCHPFSGKAWNRPTRETVRSQFQHYTFLPAHLTCSLLPICDFFPFFLCASWCISQIRKLQRWAELIQHLPAIPKGRLTWKMAASMKLSSLQNL